MLLQAAVAPVTRTESRENLNAFLAFFCAEIFLFKECARNMTVTALTVCRLFSLPGDTLKELLEAYPEIGEEITKCAIQDCESLTGESCV